MPPVPAALDAFSYGYSPSVPHSLRRWIEQCQFLDDMFFTALGFHLYPSPLRIGGGSRFEAVLTQWTRA